MRFKVTYKYPNGAPGPAQYMDLHQPRDTMVELLGNPDLMFVAEIVSIERVA